jgi:hypothetical protein
MPDEFVADAATIFQCLLAQYFADTFKARLFAVLLTEHEKRFSLILQSNLVQRETVESIVKSPSVVSRALYRRVSFTSNGPSAHERTMLAEFLKDFVQFDRST